MRSTATVLLFPTSVRVVECTATAWTTTKSTLPPSARTRSSTTTTTTTTASGNGRAAPTSTWTHGGVLFDIRGRTATIEKKAEQQTTTTATATARTRQQWYH
jgi:hypothetical protein